MLTEVYISCIHSRYIKRVLRRDRARSSFSCKPLSSPKWCTDMQGVCVFERYISIQKKRGVEKM